MCVLSPQCYVMWGLGDLMGMLWPSEASSLLFPHLMGSPKADERLIKLSHCEDDDRFIYTFLNTL